MMMHLAIETMLAVGAAVSTQCVDFAWRPISFGAYTAERAAIIIPVSVEGVGEALPLQLDTGAAATMLYADDAAPQTARKVRVAGAGWGAVIVPLADPGAGAAAPGEPVGTAGVDLFPQGFVLDLPRRQLCPLAGEEGFDWQPMQRVNGSPVIAVEDDGRTLAMLLDTGSAAFAFLSTPALSGGIAQARPVRTLSVPSFGRQLAITELEPNTPLSAFGRPLAVERVHAFADPDIEQMLRGAGIDGLIGMSAFDGALAFDFAQSRIGYRPRPATD
jgi:hypothetical protein